MNTTQQILNTAVVGCGAISDIYLENMIYHFDNLNVTACCANHLEHAKTKADAYGIKGCTYEEILKDPSIDMVVILTPAPTHEILIRQALEAGKHVYTEKTMTLSAQSAMNLQFLAKSKGLYLGSAPDTFLGAALQTARKAIDDGLIGEVTSFDICANRDLDYLSGVSPFLCMPGGGICYDYSVYHLTALVSLLGPVESVSALVRNLAPQRTNTFPDSPTFGQKISYPNESQVFSILKMEHEITGTLSINGDSVIHDLAHFMIYGKKGILKLTDPNTFGGNVIFLPAQKNFEDHPAPEILNYGFSYEENSRGLGPSEMADAIFTKRESRTNASLAIHVLDVIDHMVESSEKGAFVQIPTTCRRPEPLLRRNLF
jgi:predicted dehydrogenase